MSVGLKLIHVGVPEHRSPGEIAELVCEYELGTDTLYSVKWYKGILEFYRFTPKAVPQAMTFKVEGVNVDVSQGKNSQLNFFFTTILFLCRCLDLIVRKLY